jgi:hypothetical protein
MAHTAADSPLAALIAAFSLRPDATACADPDTAFGACVPVSRRFAAAARAAGMRASIIRMECWEHDGFAEPIVLHDVALVEGVIVDWSARQFAMSVSSPDGRRPDAAGIPVPLIVVVGDGRDWPDAAFARGGVDIWDSARIRVADDGDLGDTGSTAVDWLDTRSGGLGGLADRR